MSIEQESLIGIVGDWNDYVGHKLEQEFTRLNQRIYELSREVEEAEKRMNTALAYAEKHQPPQPEKQARV